MNDLQVLGQYLAGEYDNRAQAMADPVWYVHLKCWMRPVPLFCQDSMTLFAEQASVLQLDQPYRQRLIRLRKTHGQITAQFYSFRQPLAVLGAGCDSSKVDRILTADIDELPGCILQVTQFGDRFSATPAAGCICQFTYPGKDGQRQTGQVELGFEVSATTLHSYDKGIDPVTQKPIWGALMGPYRYTKQQAYPL
jgi:hypothetical protein